MWKELNSKGTWRGEITNKCADGSLIHEWMSITALKNEINNETENYMAIFSNFALEI